MSGLLSRLALPLMLICGASTANAAEPLPAGFTAADLAQIHSADFVQLPDGNLLPLSNEPITDVFDEKTAPQDFKTQWGKFKILSHSKGYIHLGEAPDEHRRQDLYELVSDVSNYLKVKNYDGNSLFESLTPIDSKGNKISKFPQPPKDAQDITLYARANVSIESYKLTVDIQFNIQLTSEGLLLQMFNFRPIRYGILGQIIPTEGLFVQLEFFGFDKGWLVESFTLIETTNFLARYLDPDDVGGYGASIMELLTNETVYPVPPPSNFVSF